MFFSESGSTGALWQSNVFGASQGVANSESSWGCIALDATKSNGTYGNSKTVQPNALRLLAIIKT